MTRDEVIEVLHTFAKEIDFIGNLREPESEIKKEKEKLFSKLIDDLEIPYEFNCDICEDTGETTTMEQVYAGEPHVAPIGTQVCVCQIHEREYEPDEE